MDCKKASIKTGGDFKAGHDTRRSEGLASTKKSSRTATECRVGLAVTGTMGVAVEVNSGTDSVAKNKQPNLHAQRRAGRP
jgi:elongation factor Ts